MCEHENGENLLITFWSFFFVLVILCEGGGFFGGEIFPRFLCSCFLFVFVYVFFFFLNEEIVYNDIFGLFLSFSSRMQKYFRTFSPFLSDFNFSRGVELLPTSNLFCSTLKKKTRQKTVRHYCRLYY